MSAIGLREWETWQNNWLFRPGRQLRGQFELQITPSLMAGQTIEFIVEQIDRLRVSGTTLNKGAAGYFSPHLWTDKSLVVRKLETLDTSADLQQKIYVLLQELNALAMFLDFPLACNYLEYVVPPGQAENGKALIARRRPIVRGMAFEVDERVLAANKIINNFDVYNDQSDLALQVANEHYLTGQTLLGLEDSYAGLVDAVFMQFY